MTTINVTAEHIANGKREDCERCPVALAILDAFPAADSVLVGPEAIAIAAPDGSRTDLEIPPEAVNFVWDFDDGGPKAVQPFTFELDYPAEVTA